MLKTRITVDTAWSILSAVPTIAELTLDNVAPDSAGRVVDAVSSLQPDLRVLKLNFRRRFTLNAGRDLAALSNLSRLQVLEIGNKWGVSPDVDFSTYPANPHPWQLFLRNLPYLRTLKLPKPWEVPSMTSDLWRSGGRLHCLQYMQVNGSLGVGAELLFPCLQTLIRKWLLPEKTTG